MNRAFHRDWSAKGRPMPPTTDISVLRKQAGPSRACADIWTSCILPHEDRLCT